MTKLTRNNDTALAAFMNHKLAIEDLLTRLLRHSREDHFGVHPHEVDFGHVGTLAQVEAKLREISDFVFQDGEHS